MERGIEDAGEGDDEGRSTDSISRNEATSPGLKNVAWRERALQSTQDWTCETNIILFAI